MNTGLTRNSVVKAFRWRFVCLFLSRVHSKADLVLRFSSIVLLRRAALRKFQTLYNCIEHRVKNTMEPTSVIVLIVGVIIFLVTLIPSLLSSRRIMRSSEESVQRSKTVIEHSLETSKRNSELAEQTLEVRKELLQTQKEANSLLRELISKIEKK